MSLVERNPTGIPSDIPQPSMAWWDSNNATIVKYSLLGVLLFVLLLWLIVGSVHARRRIESGREPLRYHRWLVPKSHRPIYWQQNSLAYYRRTGGVSRRVDPSDPDPPPEYDAVDMPPIYQPPKSKPIGEMAIPLPAYGEFEGESSQSVRNVPRTHSASSMV